MRWTDDGFLVEKKMQCFRGDKLVHCEQVGGGVSRKVLTRGGSLRSEPHRRNGLSASVTVELPLVLKEMCAWNWIPVGEYRKVLHPASDAVKQGPDMILSSEAVVVCGS
jgi:hypothetical protein